MFLFCLILVDEEVGIDGWNTMDNCYAFLYSKVEEGKKRRILVKCLVIDDFLAIDPLVLQALLMEPCIVQIKYVPVLLFRSFLGSMWFAYCYNITRTQWILAALDYARAM